MECPKCSTSMRVTDTRPLARNPQVTRRRRVCESCETSFQTDERPRLWVVREEERELFLRGVLLASLRRAAKGVTPAVAEKHLLEVVRLVIVGFLSDGIDGPSAGEVRVRTGRILLDQRLDQVAHRYDPDLDPDSFLVGKRDGGSEPFDLHKLQRSIAAASVKLLDEKEIEVVAAEVENEVGATSGPIDTERLRAVVNRALRRHDERAFLRYDLGASAHDETLEDFLSRVTPAASVTKRDGTVVLFDGAKLSKSIRRSFAPDRRDDHTQAISEYVSDEERRVRDRMSVHGQPEPTSDVGSRVLEWLFELDELAWANYWLVFASDHELEPGGSPSQQLAKAQTEMRLRKRSRKHD